MKNIIGLDLGTNSIGWAKVSVDGDKHSVKIGSRIIPMNQDVLGNFDKGVTVSQTASRTEYRGTRRLRERCLLRRERLNRILHVLNFLPEHFDNALGWNKNQSKTYGKFIDDSEPKIAWKRNKDGKMEFIFMESFLEMVDDFKKVNPTLKQIPLDWTIYYLRDKALRQPISKQELAWILLNFNQKRGYYQLRGEDEEEKDSLKKEEYYELKVVKVEATEDKKGDATWYNVVLENGFVYRRASATTLADWEGKIKEFIVTTEYDADGNVKLNSEGKPKRSFRAPGENDWKLRKKRTEASIDASGKTVGTYIYESLRNNPTGKIRGKLVHTVERKFYKEELCQILSKQKEFIPELSDNVLFYDCIRELYPRNIAHQNLLRQKDIVYLIIEDLLFYQRPLKSKKSLIANCPLEQYSYVDKSTGEIKVQHIKCIAKSNPYFQEFRLWQFVQNLRLFQCDTIDEVEVTSTYLATEEDYVRLFTYLNDRNDISQDTLLKEFFGIKKPKGKDAKYPVRWNYVEGKAYPCNETRHILLIALQKAGVSSSFIADKNMEYRLWHLLYSVDDRIQFIAALKSMAKQFQLPELFVDVFKKIPSFKKEYAAYSEKAIKKMLAVMRMGSMWNAADVPSSVNAVIDGTIDETIKKRIGSQGINLTQVDNFRGLPVWLAGYAVYGRHSESDEATKWESPADLKRFINGFKQNSMRNPIVEQCILETLRTVYDLWVECGHIDEIHVELGRNMKSTAEQRKRISERNIENENTNLRIRQLLTELNNDESIADVRPYSPMQQEILRIYEEGALQELKKEDKEFADIQRISRLANPSQSEITKYRLWLEQKYISPYTGRAISLSKLFTPAYQIEHIIPQARFFDDSLSNKVICEAEVNHEKSNMLGFEFIKKCGGQIIHTVAHGDVKVMMADDYKKFVAEHYATNRAKSQKLLMVDIPEEFIQRQMNDSRYISKVIMRLLSNVVREEGEVESTSKNVIPCSGGITDRLKHDWGLNDVWNRIVSPRFIRMNTLTNSDKFGKWEDKEGKQVFQTTIPLELQRGFSKKRIDHRHHAMDALAIALASRSIVSYLNNESASDTKHREDLRKLLCDKNRIIRKPWPTFTQDAYEALMDVVVSFKHYVRVINKATNYYEHYDADGHKSMIPQESADLWAVRKPLHKETVFGHVNLRRTKEVVLAKALEKVDSIANIQLRKYVKNLICQGMTTKQILKHFKDADYMFEKQTINKVVVYYYTDEVEELVATRKALDETFDAKKIMSITDTGIQRILLNYLKYKEDKPTDAFSPEGIAELNENISKYNNDKPHMPILKVRLFEPKGEKYKVGATGNKSKKYVVAQSGTNLFFAIYEDTAGVRSYQTIPLNQVLESLKMGLPPVPEYNIEGVPLKFHLSPNDLVYVPTADEQQNANIDLDKSRIYKFVDSSGTTANFVPANTASLIYKVTKEEAKKYSSPTNIIQDEYGVGSPQSKNQKSIDNLMVKAVCWKLEVDRLGNIVKVIR